MPTSWNELSEKQLINVCELYMRGLEEQEFLSLAALHLSGIRVADKSSVAATHQFRHKRRKFYMDVFQFASLCNSVRFLLNPPSLNIQKIPDIRILGKKYYGPSTMISNMTFGEWIQVDIYMQHYGQTKERKYLQMAAAAMYRRCDKKKVRSEEYDGDPRRKFNEHLVERNSKIFNRVSDAKLMAISIFFNGCVKTLKNLFPLTLQESSGSGRGDLLKDTLSMIDQLNNDDVTKNNAVQQTRLYEVLAKLEITREQARKLKKKTA